MKKFLILLILCALPVIACSQQRVEGSQTIAWQGDSSIHEIAIQADGGEIIKLGQTASLQYEIDLEALGHHGVFTILIRAVEFTAPDMYDYTEWIRSDNEADVIMVDGVYMTFQMENRKMAIMPTLMRIIGE